MSIYWLNILDISKHTSYQTGKIAAAAISGGSRTSLAILTHRSIMEL